MEEEKYQKNYSTKIALLMKWIYIFGMFLLFSCNNDYKKITSDFNLHSYYIAVKIANKDTQQNVKRIVIENGMLYSTLNKDDDLSEDEYQTLVVSAIRKDQPIIVEKKLFKELRAFELKLDDTIEKLNSKGINELKDAFFNEGVQYNALTDSEKKHLIYCLFAKGLFVKTDDESGKLVLEKP